MNLRPSNRGDCYAPGCIDYPKQMQLSSSSCNYQSSYGYHSGSHSSVGSANDAPPIRNGPLPNKGYHMHPPPPSISNQFSHDRTEKDRARSWRDHSSPFERGVQFANEVQGGHFYGDGCARRPVQNEVSERCRFSSASRSGMMVFSYEFISHFPVMWVFES